ncbi:MAG TPA: hypothetical protein VFD73_01250 [Gemmatimonadales bacterium]|nr:hypothetical protein [Gemmatimonadales bacterium]
MCLIRASCCWAAFFLLSPPPLAAQGSDTRNVAVQMRHVDFHVDSTIVLRIEFLRGDLEPTSPDHAPYFDDKTSFNIKIDSAQVRIAPEQLGYLLNRYTFAYPGSPLRHLSVSVEKGQLKQEGTLKGVSFTMLGDLSLTSSGELRLHPTSVKAIGMKVGGLMKFLGLNLEKLVKVRGARGVRIDKNDFFLDPAGLLPPPLVRGRVVATELTDSAVSLTFHPADSSKVKELAVPNPKVTNYMYYRGNVLRFGKLTMRDTDLLIEDANPDDPFDFFLDHYLAQLVAGYSRTRPDQGLTVVMQDFAKTPELPARKTENRQRTPS